MNSPLRRLGLVFVLMASQSPSLYAQPKEQSSSYFYQLGVLVGEIRTIQHLGDLCARMYPETSTANQQAVDAWKAKYGATIRDVDTQFAGLRKYWRSVDGSSDKEVAMLMERFENMLAGIPKMLEEEHLNGPDKEEFAAVCENYPLVLEQARFNPEEHHAAALAIVRRGPPAP